LCSRGVDSWADVILEEDIPIEQLGGGEEEGRRREGRKKKRKEEKRSGMNEEWNEEKTEMQIKRRGMPGRILGVM
jgi:hypothetical protein